MSVEASAPVPQEMVSRGADPACTEPSPPQPEDALNGLKALAEIGGVLLALAFVGGWSCMSSYYRSFGVDPLDLDSSVPATSAFAIHMFRHSIGALTLATLMFATFTVLYPKLGSARRAFAGLLIAFLLFAFAVSGSARGTELAKRDMFLTTSSLPSIGFEVKAPPLEPRCLARGACDCKLLLHAKGVYYFFEPVKATNPDSARGMNVAVYIVPDAEVKSARLERGVE
jgi:hypothetical protein